MPAKYVLTATAAADLADLAAWSLSRWGKNLTDAYLDDLHAGAQYVAGNHGAAAARADLSGGAGLSLYPVREHYIVYVALSEKKVAVVAFIRAGRDLPDILRKNAARFMRALAEIERP